jgi:hypothetical protein
MLNQFIDTAIIAERFRFDEPLIRLFKECTPKILVVTDNGLNFGSSGFGLEDFVDTLKATTIHGMTPIVKTAHTGASAADYTNFQFTSSTLSKSKYDVLFLFGFETGPALPPAEVDVITTFMQAGGGVFATGDHAQLGKGMCNDIPRVRSMRYWSSPDVPSSSGFDRLSTNRPGSDSIFQFADQSDDQPQHIYPLYYPASSGIPADAKPHYMLQHPTKQVIEVLPDHPHEGECVVPTNLTTPLSATDNRDEWPTDSSGTRVEPELIALSMSYGGGFSSKQPLTPRSFGAIGAYDGQKANVGRVAVDATWHHFININLTGAGSPRPGLQSNADAIDRVHTYFRNIAEWLMPKNRRWCLRWPLLRHTLELFPLAEIIPEIGPRIDDNIQGAIELGEAVEKTLSQFVTPAAMNEIKQDVLSFHKTDLVDKLSDMSACESFAQDIGRRMLPRDTLFHAALGSATWTLAKALPVGEDMEAALSKAGGAEGLEKLIISDLKNSMGKISERMLQSMRELESIAKLI